MKSSVFAALLACVIAVAAAQDIDTGGQTGSVVADNTTPSTTPPVTTAPGMAAPNGVDSGAPASPNGVDSGAPSSPNGVDSGAPAQPSDVDSAATTPPNGVDSAAPAPPSAATPVTQAPGPVWAANPAPMTDSGSGSLAHAGKIEPPATKKLQRVTDSSQSHSSSSVPSETSSAPMLIAAAGAWTLAGLLGSVAML